ncbi:uncharacterized protein THITE_2153998 [Thermothielavioides terrestris NRRL 8126]|uniref:Uncharacterized protein n=2 Tax=Thermothielavioides terrestris TaxID=2587410 RepID=G2QY59_THETT|nr:uncharacterized protein THITE_2153998 [Thermothielavioides terrestris NRRL 8126]AEO65353.1 hypothetical protein THITE_2153998 [Thermothielavioides terrestris NRRL 8126]
MNKQQGRSRLERPSNGAIPGSASPGVHRGVMLALDAHDGDDKRATGAASPRGKEPLLVRQTTSSFDPSGSSWQLPFFVNNSSSSSIALYGDPSSPSALDNDCFPSPVPILAPHADCLPLFYTFYRSPSASRLSDTSSFCSSALSLSDDSGGTPSTMPGLTCDAAAEPRFLGPSGVDSLSSPSATSLVDTGIDTAQLRPISAKSGRSERTAKPLRLARWTRWHHCHQAEAADRSAADGKTSHSFYVWGSPQQPSRSRSSSIQKRQSGTGAVPQMTREQFEALPLAIQRKYFSTLERLRFAQESGLVDGISRHYHDISSFKRWKPRQERDAPEHTGGRRRRGSIVGSHPSAPDSSTSLSGLSEATQEVGPRREEQIAVAGRQRTTVILDAADEAVYKLNQQSSRRNLSTTASTSSPFLSPARDSMEFSNGLEKHADESDGHVHVPQSFYDSFRWLDEEEDLDLRLFLDDYHANLREDPPTTKQRPSFRRHMSISKIPFGRRSSVSSSRPGTNGTATPASPIHSPAGSVSNGLAHVRRKSRALSLITPRHAPQPSITAFDPAAAHYQDPEARLKLRVYLASPQKFDEAVEFGFPSADALSAAPMLTLDTNGISRGHSKQKSGVDSPPYMRTFLADGDDDDNLFLNDDQLSLADSDSPKTPEPLEHSRAIGARHARLASAGLASGGDLGRRTPEGGCYAQAPASSREMTLRMTLTRPDLRAHEDEMYGRLQKQGYQQQQSRRPKARETRGVYPGPGAPKDSLEKFPEIDHWNGGAAEKGVMRRFWNRMRRV